MAPPTPPESVPIPITTPLPPTTHTVSVPADSSVWSRITTWVSENKAVVYTIAGVAVVVTTAGAVYYIRNSSVSPCASNLANLFAADIWLWKGMVLDP